MERGGHELQLSAVVRDRRLRLPPLRLLGLLLLLAAPSPSAAPRPDAHRARLYPMGLHVLLSTSSRAAQQPLRLDQRPRPTRVGPGSAFRDELRHEALRYRDTSPFAFVPEELEDVRNVREARADAAEDILSDALEAAAEVVLRDLVGRTRRKNPGPTDSSGVHAGVRLDSSPSLRIRTRGEKGNTRLDIPLTAHQTIRLRRSRVSHRLQGPRVVSTSIGMNPWDRSAHIGFSCGF